MKTPRHSKYNLKYGDQTLIANSINCSARCVRKVIKGNYKQETRLQLNIIYLAEFLEKIENRNEDFSIEFENVLEKLELNKNAA
ncbi:hypothetical protein V9L05_20430 [Bernardetia sp. Wsw4-3y2]|uniref:hypothetical protein n=1 Tax=Bernardetia sp. Wsw4-3y2 TaxID=3127471 RepID=UPI0030CB80AE